MNGYCEYPVSAQPTISTETGIYVAPDGTVTVSAVGDAVNTFALVAPKYTMLSVGSPLKLAPLILTVAVGIAIDALIEVIVGGPGGGAYTVITVVTVPHGREYVIVVVPPVIPITAPVAALMVATDVLLLLHVPPEVASDKFLNRPAQNAVLPQIGAGRALAVMVVVIAQPAPDV
jgi:hypothetical protein